MKKILFMLLAVVAMVCTTTTLSSCGDNDNEYDNSALVGTWSQTTTLMLGVTATTTFSFDKAGNCVYTVKSSTNDITTTLNGTYTYSTKSKMLVITYTNNTEEHYIVDEVTSTTLKMSNYVLTKQ